MRTPIIERHLTVLWSLARRAEHYREASDAVKAFEKALDERDRLRRELEEQRVKLGDLLEAARLVLSNGMGTTWRHHGADPRLSRIVHGGQSCDCPSPRSMLRKALEEPS